MLDINTLYDQIEEFYTNTTERTMLLCGNADKEKHRTLLRVLNEQGHLNGLILLIHTTRDGMQSFFRWAELYKMRTPSRYGESMRLQRLTITFQKLSLKETSPHFGKYDFIIVWPIQSITQSKEEITKLQKVMSYQETKKIFYLTIHEPRINPESVKPISDRVVILDYEDNSEE